MELHPYDNAFYELGVPCEEIVLKNGRVVEDRKLVCYFDSGLSAPCPEPVATNRKRFKDEADVILEQNQVPESVCIKTKNAISSINVYHMRKNIRIGTILLLIKQASDEFGNHIPYEELIAYNGAEELTMKCIYDAAKRLRKNTKCIRNMKSSPSNVVYKYTRTLYEMSLINEKQRRQLQTRSMHVINSCLSRRMCGLPVVKFVSVIYQEAKQLGYNVSLQDMSRISGRRPITILKCANEINTKNV
jgi:hypothetical protein